jgi:Helix-turn-helix domain.
MLSAAQSCQSQAYRTPEQQILLAQHFGCARWWWNYALNKSIESYKETGEGLGQSAVNSLLPGLKKLKRPYGYLNVIARYYKQRHLI